MGITIGIDLGTTNSVCAYLDSDRPTMITNTEGQPLTPSVVGFRGGIRTIGRAAKRQQQLHPELTVHSIKRFMGRRFDEAQADFHLVGYQILRSESGDCVIDVENRRYTPQEISSMLLRALKGYSDDFLGETVTEAVVTVPAYFNDRQRQATKDAGALAGIDILRVINEPTAAALAYNFQKKGRKKIAVYDFGGGTFDISILELDDDVAEVLATRGDNTLGGNDIDNEICNWILGQFKEEHDVDLREDSVALQRIREEAERVKIELSSTQAADINLPFIYADENGPKNLIQRLTREEMERLITPYLDRTIKACRQAVEDAWPGKNPEDSIAKIDEVILVGGSSRIPMAQAKLKEFFKCRINKSMNPEEVVAAGAAIQAGNLSGDASKAITLLDVTAFSLGIEVAGGKFAPLINKNTTIPTETLKRVTTTVDNQRTVKVHVLQGESPNSAENTSLGYFELTNIQPAPAKVPQVQVHFAIDSNGMVQVTASDLRSGVSEKIIIENTDGLSDVQKEQMKHHLDLEEEEHKKLSELRDSIQNQISQVDRMIKSNKDRLHQKSLEQVRTFQSRAKSILQNSGDTDKLGQLLDKLGKLRDDLAKQLG
jgi:molecular chaperone DnaK